MRSPSCREREPTKSPGLDAGLDRLDAESGSVEHANGSMLGMDRRIDDVLGVVFVRAGDVAGSVKPGRAAMATFAARPIPNSCIPPHQTGTPLARQTSWIRFASSRPPTRLTLMLITRQAPRSSALRASSAEWMLSSRQIGVLSAAWSLTWSMMSSWASGCSIRSRSKASSAGEWAYH